MLRAAVVCWVRMLSACCDVHRDLLLPDTWACVLACWHLCICVVALSRHIPAVRNVIVQVIVLIGTLSLPALLGQCNSNQIEQLPPTTVALPPCTAGVL
jgi:hypothetical protein